MCVPICPLLVSMDFMLCFNTFRNNHLFNYNSNQVSKYKCLYDYDYLYKSEYFSACNMVCVIKE